MDTSIPVKEDILKLLFQTYGDKVGELFQNTQEKALLPIFVENSYSLLKQNMGKYKAAEQMDNILSRHGISVSAYE